MSEKYTTPAYVASVAADEANIIRTETIRKGIHFLSAAVPPIAAISREFALFSLASAVIVYAYSEFSRLRGNPVPVVSRLTVLASRSRDEGRFVLGPVTLALGVMLSLLLYPNPAATIAIYALAFGDGFASLVGRILGRVRPAFLRGKSLEGSAACFMATAFAAYRVSGKASVALTAAVTATITEALPLGDFDNIALPVIVGWSVLLFL